MVKVHVRSSSEIVKGNENLGTETVYLLGPDRRTSYSPVYLVSVQSNQQDPFRNSQYVRVGYGEYDKNFSFFFFFYFRVGSNRLGRSTGS